MNLEKQLNVIADKYRTLGFNVVLHPGPQDLPPFAKDFKVELMATRDDVSALVSAKGSPAQLEADPNIVRYTEITDKQPGWRFDLFILGPDMPVTPEIKGASELSDEDLQRCLDEVERMLQAGFVAQALVAAWAVLESAMRRRLRAAGEAISSGDSPRTMLNELYSAGIFSTSVLRELERLFNLRNAIVHGFSVPVVEPNVVQLLMDEARRLLTETQLVKQSA